jgi:HK97 family phage portal protein
MGLKNFIQKTFRKKSFGDQVQYGGFELLTRLTAGSWSKTTQLEQYEKSLYVAACVNKIAQKVASNPFSVFKIRNSRGDTVEILNHPVIDLLYKVNPFQTKSEFFKITMINKKLTGDAFWYKVRNSGGRVVELWNLRPDYVEIIKDPEKFIKGYRFTKTDGTTENFPPEDIVHLKGANPLDAYYGNSPIRSAQVRIDTEGFASTYQRDFFLNNARPDGILKTAGGLTDEQRIDIKTTFEKRHRGQGKNSLVALLEAGLEYQQVSVNQKEMDFIESLKFTRDDILVAFQVPKPIVAVTDDVNRANAETALTIFLGETIKPELDELEEKINEELVTPDFGADIFLQFKDPTPQNREQAVKEYDSGIIQGWMLINEVRAKENLPPIDGGWDLYKPLGVAPVGGLNQAQKMKFVQEYIDRKEAENKERRMKIFRGKEALFKRMVVAEKAMEILAKRVKKTAPTPLPAAKKLKKKELTGLIKGDDFRNQYAGIILKAVDTRARKLKTEMDRLAYKQKEKLIVKLGHIDLTKSKKAIGASAKKTIKTFFDSEHKVYTEFIFPFLREYASEGGAAAIGLVQPGAGFDLSQALLGALKVRAVEFGLGVNVTTRDKITQAVSAGLEAGEGMVDISKRITDVYDEFSTYRSDRIARTEATASSSEGTLEGYRQSNVVTGKEWIATMDGRTRESHADTNGEIVPLNEKFSNGVMYPGDMHGEPAETINCRCVLGPAMEK